MRQGYLSRPGDGLTVRVRTSEPRQGGAAEQAWLTLKAPSPSQRRPPGLEDGPLALPGAATAAAVGQSPLPDPAQADRGLALSRLEFEYRIPPTDAQALLALTDQQLVKCRHGLDLPGGDWVLDVFEGLNAPLVVAEVELGHPAQPVDLPAWCVRDVTGRRDLSNAALASRPLAHWSDAERSELLPGL